MPRACPVEFSRSLLFSWEREPPRLKAVASSFAGWQNPCIVQREDSTGQAPGIFDFLCSLSPVTPALIRG